MHVLIHGEPGVGKSTLIQRLLQNAQGPVYGFYTKKEAGEGDGAPVYIHGPTGARMYGEENRVAVCGANSAKAFLHAFERCGVALLSNIPRGALVVMDELGFLENSAAGFQRAVLAAFEEGRTVIAAVKPRSTPFLDAVRTRENALLFYLDLENRSGMYEQVWTALQKAAPKSPLLGGKLF